MTSWLILLTLLPLQTNTEPEPVAIWPEFAPGESSQATGELLPFRPQDNPPISRVTNIRNPTLDVFPAKDPNGAAVLILPGGGFGRVVPDMEGSEAAKILNESGITCFVLRYRTKLLPSDAGWKRPLQDSQRAMKWIRHNADKWNIDSDRVGLLGFSAGGQVAARLMTDDGKISYDAVDGIDQIEHQPNFGILIYPWNMYDQATDALVPEISVSARVPPTFIVHTHDDRSSSLGSVLFYAGLKKAGVAAELHIYQNGGHGYGTRHRPNSEIGTWPARMTAWLRISGLVSAETAK